MKYVYRFAYANATLNSSRFSAYQSRPKRAIQSNAPACKKRLNQDLSRQSGGFLIERAAIGRQAGGGERGESVCVNKMGNQGNHIMAASGKSSIVAASLILVVSLSLGCAFPAAAKSGEWDRLNKESTTLYEQGDLEKAEESIQQALAFAEKTYGAEDPHVATSLNNLATILMDQQRFDEAESLFRRALAIQQQALGADHPATKETQSNLEQLQAAKRERAGR